MRLDTATLFVVTMIVGIMMISVYVAVDRAMPKRIAGLRTWTLSYLFHTVGVGMVVLRFTDPGPLSLITRNFLLLAGFALAFAASCQLVGKAPPWRVLAALVAAATAAVVYGTIVNSFGVRTAAITVPEVFLYGVAAVELFRAHLPGRRNGARFLSGLFLLIALVSAARLVSMATQKIPTSVASMSGIHIVYMTVHLVAFAGVGVGVVLFAHEKLRTDLENEAWYDALTGLYARRAFFEMAERERERCLRTGEPYVLLILDLDDFKRVNDTFGHAAGDRALVATAATVREALRKNDLVGRYGGEEVMALLSGADIETGREAAERAREAVARIRLDDCPGFSPTASVGVAISASPGEDVHAVLRRADAALYRAKAAGKNRVREE